MIVHETNNTVVWLRPAEVIAKVGTHSDIGPILLHEYRVAAALAAFHAPAARPLEGSEAEVHAETGYTVTLWDRLVHGGAVTPAEIGASLRDLHDALGRIDVDMPSYERELDRARRPLRLGIPSMDPGDFAFLRDTYERLLDELGAREFVPRPLHGEPHEANRVITRDGIRWIDFEGTSLGPLEWDLVFLPEDARGAFADVDHGLLDLLTTVDAARRATWGFVMARYPDMLAFARDRFAFLRARMR